MEKEFYHFECLKSLSNIHELELQEYCNILKKLKEAFVVHSFRIFHSYGSSFNLFSNPMQINTQDDTDAWRYLHPQQHLYVFCTSQSLTQGHESIQVTSAPNIPIVASVCISCISLFCVLPWSSLLLRNVC